MVIGWHMAASWAAGTTPNRPGGFWSLCPGVAAQENGTTLHHTRTARRLGIHGANGEEILSWTCMYGVQDTTGDEAFLVWMERRHAGLKGSSGSNVARNHPTRHYYCNLEMQSKADGEGDGFLYKVRTAKYSKVHT